MPAPPPDRAGQVLAGKYRLEKLLGSGGMGDVYCAENTLIGRKVAIKILRVEHTESEEIVGRFLREARAAAMVRHPNVVDVLDVGKDDAGCPFMVQEYLEGIDLRQHMQKSGGRLSIDVALELILPVVEAMGVAHSRGVIHRDLKPANIFLSTSEGKTIPKLLDFGISQIKLQRDDLLTAAGSALGTPAYMSPEQITDTRSVDARSDVWALGILIQELITGERPFQADTQAGLFVEIATGAPIALEQLLPDVPKDLATIVTRCLRREREDRYPSAAELAFDLQQFRGGVPLVAEDSAAARPPEGFFELALPGSAPTPAGRPSQSDAKSAAPVAPSSVPDLDIPVRAPAPSKSKVDTATPKVQPVEELDELEIESGSSFQSSYHSASMPQAVRAPSAPRTSSVVDIAPAAVGAGPGGAPARAPRPRAPARFDASPVITGAIRLVVILLAACGTFGVLLRFVHKAVSWAVLPLVPSAFDGTSAIASGTFALVSLALCVGAGTVGFRASPRSWGLLVAAVGFLLLAMAMITITFSSGAAPGEPQATPDSAFLVPYLVPVVPLGFGLAALGRAWTLWDDDARPLAILAAIAGGSSLFATFELFAAR